MTLFKSLLLGTAAGIVATAGASAADLPSKKAAPVNYVKICDAYGAGFFFIPGTDTCVKLGGRVRYDVGYAPKGNFFSTDGVKDVSLQDTFGQHTRGRVDLDARTPTDFGTARTVLSLRMSQSTGVLGAKQSPYKSVDASDFAKYDASSPQIEAAYIQFMGFTVGRAKELFADGPSLSFGANSRFPSFANGALQASYTAVLGGGFSATLGIEDNSTISQQYVTAGTLAAPYHTPYDALPVVVGNIAIDQAWGRFQLSASVANNRTVNDTATVVTYDVTKTGYAYAGFLTLNADMIGKGDKFFLLGGYSNGITAHGFKDASNASSNNARDIDGIAQSYKNFTCNSAGTVCDNTTTTWVSSAFTHYWTPSVRQNLMGGMAWVDPGSIARAAAATTQKVTFSSVGTNVIWSPTKGFDIGVEVLYNRANVNSTAGLGCLKSGATAGCSASGDNFFTRMRVERTF